MLRKWLLFLFIIGLLSSALYAQDDYPIPPETPGQLFYIQHNLNHNTYVYDANMIGKSIDPDDPVEAYRIVYTQGGVRKPLNFLQRRLAYGTSVVMVGENQYDMTLAASDRLTFHIKLDKMDKAFVSTTVNEKTFRVDRMFIQLKDDYLTSSVIADYILVEGRQLIGNNKVVEKLDFE